MEKRTLLKIFFGTVVFILLAVLFLTLVFKPWAERKILSILRSSKNLTIEAEKINTIILPPGVEFEGVRIQSNRSKQGLKVTAESIKFNGISILKLVFRNDLDVREVMVLNSSISGRMSFARVKHIISSLNILAKKIIFKKFNLLIRDISDSGSWTVKDGFFSFADFELNKKDTFYFREAGLSDFEAGEIMRVTPDSFYTFKLNHIVCSSASNSLHADSFIVQPNFKDYDFTSRHEYQTDCIKAEFKNISAGNFSVADFFRSNALSSSLVEIGFMNINVFRDRRKKFLHKKKPIPQEVIYNYPGKINIDSIRVLDGDIIYTEHAENAKEPGSIQFTKLKAEIYKVTNDTSRRAENAFLELKTEALLMGRTKLAYNAKAKLFDSTDTFILSGGLSKMDVRDLNPILERNAFISAESGEIDTMSFNMTANSYSAAGTVTMLYSILFFKAKGEYAIVPASLMQLMVSAITSKRILDSNPAPGEKTRVGVIAYKRDPERFIFNYCFMAILSGIKSGISENQK